MKTFLKDKKAIVIGIVAIVIILIAAIIFVQKTEESENAQSKASQSDNISQQNSQNDEGSKNTSDNESNDKKSPLKDGESLEEMVDSFNTLPEGEEKEKLRKRLEEILASAEQMSPANNVNQEE